MPSWGRGCGWPRAPSLPLAPWCGAGATLKEGLPVELVSKHRLHIFSGRSHPALAMDVARHLGVEVGSCELVDFADGEIRARFGQSVRGTDVFVLQTHCPSNGRSINDSLMEQWLMIDAARRASAKRITAVCPYYAYARQDRKSSPREPISARMVPDFFMVSPDTGRTKVAEKAARYAGDVDMAAVYKRRSRDKLGQVEALDVMGQVDGRMCVLVDDMIDTAGTLCEAAKLLYQKGATDVWAMATHGVFSGPAIDRIKNSGITRVVVTDTLPLPPEKQVDKIETVSVAKTFADAIRAVFEEGSVSAIFGGENQS